MRRSNRSSLSYDRCLNRSTTVSIARNRVVVFFSTSTKDILEDVTDTSGVKVSAIRAIEIDTIIAPLGWVSIDIILEVFRKKVRLN